MFNRRTPRSWTTIDLTMTLLNRTAVYDIGLELAALGPKHFRYWRMISPVSVKFGNSSISSLAGKALGRLALRDLESLKGRPWPRGRGSMVFLDPIFAAKTDLLSEDIVICHDVAPVSNPEYYDPGAGSLYDVAYRKIQAAKPGIVFVSEFTRRLYLELYPADYRFTDVVPLYFKPALSADKPNLTAEHGNYFLMVGGMERRKNFAAAIDAFLASGLPEKGYELRIAGPRGNLSSDLLPKLAGRSSVKHMGYVGMSELSALYRHASALFFPSLVEGFGVPALEAVSLGTIPLVSEGTVLTEIVGPDGMTVNPRSQRSMIEGLQKIAALSTEERFTHIRKVSEYQRRFSIDAFRGSWTGLLTKSG